MTETQFTELLDELDEKGNLTGRRFTRKEIHSEQLKAWHRVIHLWVVNKNNNKQILIQKRAHSKVNHPDCWDISSAGHISAGDSSRETVQKELQEELGITCQADSFEFLMTIKSSAILNQGTYFNNEFIDLYLIELDIPELSALKLQEEEVAGVQWIDWREARTKFGTDPAFVPLGEHYNNFWSILEERY